MSPGILDGQSISFTTLLQSGSEDKRLGINRASHLKNLILKNEGTEVSKLWNLHFKKIPLV